MELLFKNRDITYISELTPAASLCEAKRRGSNSHKQSSDSMENDLRHRRSVSRVLI